MLFVRFVQTRGGRHRLSISTEERLGSLIAGAGTMWAIYVATVDYAGLWRFHILPPGPVEVCALGILAWVHAKWRALDESRLKRCFSLRSERISERAMSLPQNSSLL